MNLLEAAKQALEASEDVQEMMNTSQWFNDRVTALRHAIEQAEKQKPVAWTNSENLADLKKSVCSHMYAKKEDDGDLPLYAAPPQREWVGLTEEEKQNILDKNTHPYGRFDSYTSTLGIVNDTESKLKEKNT